MPQLDGGWKDQRRDRRHPRPLRAHREPLPQPRHQEARRGEPHAGRRQGDEEGLHQLAPSSCGWFAIAPARASPHTDTECPVPVLH
ncbi:hypothetical protein D9M69_606310 [compost metagenome]